MLAIGRIGKYELEECLGGGMSRVYRAQDTILGRTVAIKVLTDAGCADPEAKVRFLTEARLASNLIHDNILSIYDFGEDDQHHPYMVMEFLRGQTVRSAIRKCETGDVHSKLGIALQAGRALEYLHSHKVIHRDVKPENLHLSPNGVVKLMDFGIAKAEGINLTLPGFVLGTPYYMAPEQVRGETLTEQVDVYAFGVFLFELMTGVKPISGDTVERIFHVILNEPLDLAPLAASGAPAAICDLVARCVAKDPAARPQGFGPVCAALEELLLVPGPSAAVAAAPDAPAEAVPETPAEPVARRAGWRLAVWLVAGALLLLPAVGFGLAWLGYFRLDARLRSEVAAVSAGGAAPGGLVSSGALSHFDKLRDLVETVDRYHRHGAPLGYRLGSLIGGDLYRPARSLYFGLFRSSFLERVHNNQLTFLRSLPAKPGPAYSPVYETLKAYLMTTSNPAQADAQFLVPVLAHWWSLGLDASLASEDAVRRQFGLYAEELVQDDPFPTNNDVNAVGKARQYLSQFASADRLYALLLQEAAQRNPAVSFNRQFAGSENVLAETYEVPGPFTRAGWDFVKDAIAHPEGHFASESWVADESHAAPDPGQVAESITSLYRADYVRAWRQYLGSGSFARFASLAEAGQKLEGLAHENSVLEQWLSLAARNTSVDVSAVAQSFQAVRDAQAVGHLYRTLLAGLGSSARNVAAQAAAQSGVQLAQALTLAEQDLTITAQIAAAFHRDPEGHVEAQIARMLAEPVMAARNALSAAGRTD
jgi:hypothetical protein